MTERERKAFDKGASARRRGKSAADNPYTHETTIQSANFWAWKHGYEEQGRAAGVVCADGQSNGGK